MKLSPIAASLALALLLGTVDRFVRAEDAPKSPVVVEKKDASEPNSEEREIDDYDYPSLFDAPEILRKLDKTAPIWVSKDRVNVALGGVICLREGPLEFFACRRDSKEHESIVSLDLPPHLIHAALLAIGASQGAPAKYDPVFVPPSGDKIEIEVRWRDGLGSVQKIRAQELVLENESGATMKADWVFTGGLFGVDPDGKKYYLANVTGEVFGVSNFPGSVLDVPFESSSDNASLCYAPNTPKIPPVGTKVLLILSKKGEQKDEK
ncbi:MAG: hypothetical protein IJM30_05475 [Thermoguttaceae bacterium]|nr:hypothetical protein [Thermoguttaceae bacterium]